MPGEFLLAHISVKHTMMVGECRQNATAHMGPAVGQASVSSPHVSSFRAAYAPTEETNTPHGDAASLQQEHFLPLVGQPQPVQPHFLSVNPMVVEDLFPFSSHGGVTYTSIHISCNPPQRRHPSMAFRNFPLIGFLHL